MEQGLTYPAKYNDIRPFDQRTDQNNYFQLRQTSDKEYIQILSDYEPTLKYYLCNGTLAYTIPFTAVPTAIVGETFTCYEAEVNFADFAANQTYIGEITYTDDDAQVHTWACTPIDLRAKWPNSMLFEYANSENDEDGIIWDTGIVMNIRVDAVLQKFQPKSERTDYNDQDYDGSLLFGQSYRWQTLLLLNARGLSLPDWIIDKMNRIFTECDNTKISGESYIAVAGQEFKLTRPETGTLRNGILVNEDAYAEIDVQAVPNPKFGRLTTGDIPDNDEYIIMPKPIQFVDKGAPFSIANVFKENMTLIHMVIYNTGLNTFNMSIGSTPGGNDIAKLIKVGVPNAVAVINPVELFQINNAFNTPTTVYFTIPNGVDISGWLYYAKYDLPNINVNPVTPTPYLKGNIYAYYDEANYANEFDNTGVGVPGSDHEGCVIAGTNGVMEDVDWTNATLLQDITKLGTLSNDGTWTLAKTQLPNEGVGMFTPNVNATINDVPGVNDPVAYVGDNGALKYQVRKGANGIGYIGKTAPMGDGAEISNTPKGVFIAYFVYLG